jgi:hypothetical protein
MSTAASPREKAIVAFAASYSSGEHPGGGPTLFVGAIVRATESFTSSAISDATGETIDAISIPKDTIGEVKRVKKESYLVNWEGGLPATWCFEQVQAAPPSVGSHVRAITDFVHGKGKGDPQNKIKTGMVGIVKKVDSDGDMYCKWPDLPCKQYSKQWSYYKRNEVVRCAPPIVVGDRVTAQHSFRHGNDQTQVPKGSVGNVIAIHPSTNDYVVHFGHDLGYSIALFERDDVQPLDGVDAAHDAMAADEEEGNTYNGGATLSVGMRVEATAVCGKDPQVPIGNLGTVESIDKHNDFKICFDHPEGANCQWVYYKKRSIKAATLRPGDYVQLVCDTSVDDGAAVGDIGVVESIDDEKAHAKCQFNKGRATIDGLSLSSLISIARPLKVSDVVIACRAFNHESKTEDEVPVGTIGSVKETNGRYSRVVFPTLNPPIRWVRTYRQEVRHLTDEEVASGMATAHFKHASSSEENEIALALDGISINEKDWKQSHKKEQDETDSHRILFCISAGEAGIGNGDTVTFTKDDKEYTCVVIDFNVEDKTYDLQVLVNGKKTSVVLPNITKKQVKRIAAGLGQKSRGDDIDLRGPWSGDVSMLLQTLGDDFGFSISKRSGSAPARDKLLITLSEYFAEHQWDYDYYWVYYSGHGSSSGGKWCLPENTRVGFEDVRDVWKESRAAKRGARLIIVSDSCYSGKWCEALKASGDQNIAIQAASVPTSTSADLGWNGGRFTTEWTRLSKKVHPQDTHFKVGDEFVTKKNMETSKMSLKAGMKGVIEKIDSDGDFRVKTYTRCRKDKDSRTGWVYKKWHALAAVDDNETEHNMHEGIVEQLAKAGDVLKKQGCECFCGWDTPVAGEAGEMYVCIRSAPMLFGVPETDTD